MIIARSGQGKGEYTTGTREQSGFSRNPENMNK